MKRDVAGAARVVTAVCVVAVALASSLFPAPAPAKDTAAKAPTFTSVTLLIRHRVFPNFRDRQQAKWNKDFIVGDTDYAARVIRYVPDFYMDVKTRTIQSRSSEPKNPAFQIVVRQDKVPQDTSWAFLSVPPHFARKSMLSFQILRIDFPSGPPIVNADSTARPSPTPAPVGTQPSHGATPGTSPH